MRTATLKVTAPAAAEYWQSKWEEATKDVLERAE